MTPLADAGIHWFPLLGFRPAVWTPPHRADAVDPPRLIVAPDADAAMITKVPPALDPLEPYGHMTSWGTVLPEMPVAVAQPSAAELAGPVATVPWHPVAAPPWWPSVPPIWWPTMPPLPDRPCQCIVPPPGPELPPVAPVPIAASGLMLAVAVAALSLRPMWRAIKSPRRPQ